MIEGTFDWYISPPDNDNSVVSQAVRQVIDIDASLCKEGVWATKTRTVADSALSFPVSPDGMTHQLKQSGKPGESQIKLNTSPNRQPGAVLFEEFVDEAFKATDLAAGLTVLVDQRQHPRQRSAPESRPVLTRGRFEDGGGCSIMRGSVGDMGGTVRRSLPSVIKRGILLTPNHKESWHVDVVVPHR